MTCRRFLRGASGATATLAAPAFVRAQPDWPRKSIRLVVPFALEYLKLVSGTFITHIPYRGTGPQLVDLLAARTEVASVGAPALMWPT